MNNLFSGLENLGFNNINIKDIYENKKIETTSNNINNSNNKSVSPLYETSITCPVCDKSFKEKAIKTSSYKINSKDSDLFIRYSIINPYFYEVWICPNCGYSSTKVDFNKITDKEKELIRSKITTKFKYKPYNIPYDVNIAIERYKLALINSVYMESKASRKAIICLKLGWMYRLLNENRPNEDEYKFLLEALKGFENAYFNENFPLYGMDKFLCMYLIGELNRRTGNLDASLIWFSNVITSRGLKSNLKELARTQRDLVKDEILRRKKIELDTSLLVNSNLELSDNYQSTSTDTDKSNSIFKLFKKI